MLTILQQTSAPYNAQFFVTKGNQLLETRCYPNSANHKGVAYLSQHLIQQAHDCSPQQFPTKYRVSSTSDGLIRNPDDLGRKNGDTKQIWSRVLYSNIAEPVRAH